MFKINYFPLQLSAYKKIFHKIEKVLSMHILLKKLRSGFCWKKFQFTTNFEKFATKFEKK